MLLNIIEIVEYESHLCILHVPYVFELGYQINRKKDEWYGNGENDLDKLKDLGTQITA